VDSLTTVSNDPIAIAQFDRLKLDLQLKEADNRFLQEELDSKDRMLNLLTEGLKEEDQKVEAIEARVLTLEEKIATLETRLANLENI
jgi:peptidoglycan hydrolase CwlO-like protein